MLIFLDLDGVLRRTQSELYRLESHLVANFERLLRALPETQVVITSTWREAFSIKEIRAHFSQEIRERIVGKTPIASSREGHCRHREVLGFLRGKGLQEALWVALDDDPEHYPPEAPVVLTDPAVGLDEAAARRVAALIAERESRPPG